MFVTKPFLKFYGKESDLAAMHCMSCDKAVTPKSRGFIFFGPGQICLWKKDALFAMSNCNGKDLVWKLKVRPKQLFPDSGYQG